MKNWLLGRIDTRKFVDLFPPESSLLSLAVVRWSIGILFVIALVMTLNIMYTTKELAWNLSEDGYKTAADLFKAPIGIIFLAIPILALLASNHRSVQTKRQMTLTNRQIELASGQNLFANYYKHVEEFMKWCDHLKGVGSVRSKRKLHRVLFPNAREGDFELSKAFLERFDLFLNVFSDNFNSYSRNRWASFHVERHIREFAEEHWLELPQVSEADLVFDTEFGKVRFPPSGLRGFIKERLDFIKAVDELLSFYPEYISSDIVKLAARFNVDAVPEDPQLSEPFTLFGYQR
jgi:hypothetical protein